jgi:hypothetical protein
LKIYVDGATPSSIAASGTVSTTTSTFYDGAKAAGDATTGNYWKGLIDDLRVYGSPALTQSEIRSVMSATQ